VLAEPGHSGAEQYRLLETLRQYGREQLVASGEAEALHARHATHFLGLGKQAQQGLTGADMPRWLLRLEPVVGNLRAALRWALERDQVTQAFDVLGSVSLLWYYRGHPAEGRAWIDEFLASPAALGRTALRARLLRAAATMSWNQGDSIAASALVLEAIAIAREAQSGQTLANALVMRAFIEVDLGDLAAAAAAAEEATGLNGEYEMNEGRHILAQVRFYQGDLAAAREIAEQHLQERRVQGQQHAIASQLNWLGHIALAEGDLEAAGGYYRESLQLREQVAYQVGRAFTVAGCAKFAAAIGQHDRAVLLASATCAASEAVGVPARRMLQAGLQEQLDSCREELGERYGARWAEGARLSVSEAIALAHQVIEETAGQRGESRTA
jgi:tetratricopeptide (TPR) repeat protein